MPADSHLPRIEILSVDTDDGVHVQLRRGEQVAEARGPVDGGGLEDVALTALAALAELLPDTIAVTLEDLQRVRSSREVVVTILLLRVGGVPLPHAGTALVGDRPDLATVRAVLDALNRRLQILGA